MPTPEERWPETHDPAAGSLAAPPAALGGLATESPTVARIRAKNAARIDARIVAGTLVLVAADWISVAFCMWGAWHVRQGLILGLFPSFGPLLLTPRGYIRILYFLLPWTIAFAEAGLYSGRVLFWEDARRSLRACTLAVIFAALVSFATQAAFRLSRLVLAITWLATLFVVPIVRQQVKRALAAFGLWRRRVLILGAGETGRGVFERVRRNPVLGYEAVAFVDDDPAKRQAPADGLPVVGPLGDTPRFVQQFGATEILIAMPRLPRERLLAVISCCEGSVASIRLVPDMFGLATVGIQTEDLDGVMVLHMRWNLAKPWNLAIKRVFDTLVAAATLVAIAPFLALAAIAIKLDSPGPVLFYHERLGRSWTRFSCIKFRTMYMDSAQRLEQHFVQQPAARVEWEQYAKLRSSDPRITRVGRLLRRLSLDELPQLLNVMRGEMSLVGPRPYLPRELGKMGEFAETILKAPPGITGLWQVSGRNRLSFDQRLRLEEYYVRNWSLWLDVNVLLKTLGVVVRREGAY